MARKKKTEDEEVVVKPIVPTTPPPPGVLMPTYEKDPAGKFHRIRVGTQASEWVSVQKIVYLNNTGVLFAAVSVFLYQDECLNGCFTPETIVAITPMTTVVVDRGRSK